MPRKNLVKEPSTEDNLVMAPSRIILPPRIVEEIRANSNKEKTEDLTVESQDKPPLRPHISNSQLAMILRCPEQYRFRYIEGLKERPKVSMSIGKGGHGALEFNTKHKIRTGIDAPLEQVVQKASDLMDHFLRELPPSEYEKDVEPGSTKDKFISATKIFRLRDAPSLNPIGAEVEFNLDLNEFLAEPLEEPIRIINGKIDVIFTDESQRLFHPETGAIEVDDYKYTARKKTQADVDTTTQLSIYGMVLRAATGKWPSRVGYRMLHSGTVKDGPDAIALMRDPKLTTPEAWERRTARTIRQLKMAERIVRTETFYPTDNPITCSWCGYRERCQESLVSDYEAANIRAVTAPPTQND